MLVSRPKTLPPHPQDRKAVLDEIQAIEAILESVLEDYLNRHGAKAADYPDRGKQGQPAGDSDRLVEWFQRPGVATRVEPRFSTLEAQGFDTYSLEDRLSYLLYRAGSRLRTYSPSQRRTLETELHHLRGQIWTKSALDLLRWREPDSPPSGSKLLDHIRQEVQNHPNGGYYSMAERHAVQFAQEIELPVAAQLAQVMKFHSHPFLCKALGREGWTEDHFSVVLEGWQSDPNYLRLLLEPEVLESAHLRAALLEHGRDWVHPTILAQSTPEEIARVWPSLARSQPERAEAVLEALPADTLAEIDRRVFEAGLTSSHGPLRRCVLRKVGHTAHHSPRR